jgi:hypothetical protein
MKSFKSYCTLLSFLAISGFAIAQTPSGAQQQPADGWPRASTPPTANQPAAAPSPDYSAPPAQYPQQDPGYAPQGYPQQNTGYGPQGYPPQNAGYPPQNTGYGPPPGQYPNANGQPQYQGQQPQAEPPIPADLTINRGTFVTMRINQPLSSDHNQPGDAFTGTLVDPLVVNGVVLAERGQTVAGRVTQVEKAGHIKGVSKLGVQLTMLTLADGQQVPIQSSLISRRGPTSVGEDAGVIAGTTALGAAAGAAADWGRGAAIGAGAGAAAGIIGVLLTRGHPSVIYPESVLTFRVEAPVNVSTEHAPYAFHWVSPGEYEQPYQAGGPPPGAYPGRYAYAPGAPPPYYYGYGPAYYPYYWGPSVGFYYGPGFWGPRYYGGGIYIRGGRRHR